MDPWYSLGKADMLDVAIMGLHVGQLSSRLDMEWCFDAVTVNSAKIMNLDGYGLEKGCKADMVLMQAKDKIEALRLRANRLVVVRGGNIIAENDSLITTLSLGGRPSSINPADYVPSGL
jgi:cytosine deaminase